MSAAQAEAKEPKRAPAATGNELFVREVRREGRPLVLLRGVKSESGGVTVDAEVYPAGAKAGIEPRRRPYAFATREQAARFVDDALDALEYLNCYVVE